MSGTPLKAKHSAFGFLLLVELLGAFYNLGGIFTKGALKNAGMRTF